MTRGKIFSENPQDLDKGQRTSIQVTKQTVERLRSWAQRNKIYGTSDDCLNALLESVREKP
jgi:hypothetical protein